MERVYGRFHRCILAAVTGTDLPAAFLAALTANESGGSPDASFFEPGIYERLKSVASGQSVAFGSIALESLLSAFGQNFDVKGKKFQMWLTALRPDTEQVRIITKFEDSDLHELATSWGLTQIMGYNVVGRNIWVRELLDPDAHYRFAMQMLGDFSKRFGLKLNRDWEALFRCWNTGHPKGRTFDPAYVGNGLQRMKLYQEIAQAPSPATPLDGA